MRYPGINVAPPAVLPYEDFSNETWYVHMLVQHAGTSTGLLGDAIQKTLRR